MSVSKVVVEAAYQQYARNYDFAVKLYRLLGLRIEEYRSHAVDLLRLKRGDRVLDLGCGTGLSFPLLFQKIGPEGRLIGVDISSEMLACAQERVDRSNWENVQLVHSDIAAFNFPRDLNAVLSIGVFGYVTDRDRVIESIAHALVPCGRFVVIDGKHPDRWPLWLFKLFVRISQPFGLTQDYFDSHSFELVEQYFVDTIFEEFYRGLIYISSGTAEYEG